MAGQSAANDSSVMLRMGGLEFAETDRVAMVSEELYLSPDEVRVTYVMRNLTDAPVTLTVGFPLPPLADFSDDFNPTIPLPDQTNFVGFTTHVDGQQVELTPHVEALVDGEDHADLLTELGIPPIPVYWATIDALEALPVEDVARLQAAGMLDWEGFFPQWELRATFLREQTFPVGRDITIEHRYTPVAGVSLGPPLDPGFDRTAPEADWQVAVSDRYCWDEAMAARDARLAQGIPDIEAEVTYISSEIPYILTTGRNWAGPIGRFSLVVEGESDADMVSLCLPGVRYVSQSRAEFEADNFVPDDDLEVYVYRAVQLPAE
ncbi:DUF4424 domain-containing protein [Roseicyclus elongatus]|nr:DUF4424 domain-containing protein [Roseibacterium elongatum]